MFLGVAYYPEHWPKERWTKDAKLMREMNVNAVRMGEFAWCRFESREGKRPISSRTSSSGNLLITIIKIALPSSIIIIIIGLILISKKVLFRRACAKKKEQKYP